MIRSEGIWNSALLAALARLGHGETIAVVDIGFPVPRAVDVIDLAVTRNVPSIELVIRSILLTGVFEAATLANELEGLPQNETIVRTLQGLPLSRTTHDGLKAMSRDARLVVRTGDARSFSNVVLRAGVDF